MPYPVLPPEPPSIVHNLPTENVTPPQTVWDIAIATQPASTPPASLARLGYRDVLASILPTLSPHETQNPPLTLSPWERAGVRATGQRGGERKSPLDGSQTPGSVSEFLTGQASDLGEPLEVSWPLKQVEPQATASEPLLVKGGQGGSNKADEVSPLFSWGQQGRVSGFELGVKSDWSSNSFIAAASKGFDLKELKDDAIAQAQPPTANPKIGNSAFDIPPNASPHDETYPTGQHREPTGEAEAVESVTSQPQPASEQSNPPEVLTSGYETPNPKDIGISPSPHHQSSQTGQHREPSGESVATGVVSSPPQPATGQSNPSREPSGSAVATGAVSSPPQPATGQSNPSGVLTPSKPTPNPQPPVRQEDAIEFSANRQEYDQRRQVVMGEGNARMRYRGAELNAARLQVNLLSRMAVGEGNVALASGQQVFQGDRLEYDIAQNRGGLQHAKGQIYTPTSSGDFSPTLPTDVAAGVGQNIPLSEKLRAGQPPQKVTSPGGVSLVLGGGGLGLPQPAGTLNRMRFESEQLNFNAGIGEATEVRITNDPFSPPELELRADYASFRRLSPEQDEIIARRPRLVLDQKFSIPLLKERVIIDRTERDPALFRFGYDQNDKGGIYAETTVEPIVTGKVQVSVIPQFYLQRSIQEGVGNPSRLFGLKTNLVSKPTPTTTILGSAVFNNMDFGDAEENMRASLRVRQLLGTHTVAGEYSYRDRLFNGSLGYQTVQQNLGLLLSSPAIPVGNTGVNLSYQASAQYINADSDRLDLLEPIRENNRINLSRFQASAAISRPFTLWQGKPLAATRTEGLRYTPAPVVPFVRLFGGLTGVTSAYDNGDKQNALTSTVGLQGQFGHFSRRWLDYTGFNISYSQVLQNGESPFLFDRVADAKVIGAGLTQQLYGPLRIGVQAAFNIETRDRISTDFILEYSRRTYGLNFRYNPERQMGSLNLRISDFNWVGGGEPFSRSEVRSVDGGVRRSND